MIKVFFDLETTGFSEKFDKVIEIAAIAIDDETQKVISTFQSFVNPGISIPAKITQITSITNETVKDAPTEVMAFEKFDEFLNSIEYEMLCGHNIDAFDMRWLRDRKAKYDLNMDLSVDTLDTLAYSRALGKSGKLIGYDYQTKTGRPSFRLELLMAYFEMGEQNHRAIDDVMNNIKVYFKLKSIDEDSSSLGF